MRQGKRPRTRAVAAIALAIVVGTSSTCTAQSTVGSARSILEPAVWQGSEMSSHATSNSAAPSSKSTPPASGDSTLSVVSPRRIAFQAAPPTPPQSFQVPSGPATPPQTLTPPSYPPEPATTQPLLDGNTPVEELLPPVVEGCNEFGGSGGRRGVQPYGGGHPWDWSWGCGGSPYRTGPGICDNWKVGPRWHITVDGMVMSRKDTDLAALEAQMRLNDLAGTETFDVPPVPLTPQTEQFDYGPGGRITFTSQIARCAGYDVQAVYEGVNNWDSSIVFPKLTLPDLAVVIPPDPNTFPPDPFPEGFQQRSLHYQSSLNSGELNFLTRGDPEWRPFFGVRYLKFDDRLSDFLNEERQIPLPGPRTDFIGPAVPPNIAVNDPIGPTWETDRLNIFHLQNNLMGFQAGLLHDTVRLNERFAIEGFVSGGVYYNKIKYSNVMGVFTTQTFADNTRSTDNNDARTDQSNILNNDARELSEISTVTEASVTGVCRLNKCWALRGGYQVLWITNVHTADTAFLGDSEESDDLLFHGWHAGIECRR